MSDLKPCPFCGTDCACTQFDERRNAWFVAFCEGQTDDFVTDNDAAYAWNRRVAAPVPDGERVRAAAEALVGTVHVRLRNAEGTDIDEEWVGVKRDAFYALIRALHRQPAAPQPEVEK